MTADINLTVRLSDSKAKRCNARLFNNNFATALFEGPTAKQSPANRTQEQGILTKSITDHGILEAGTESEDTESEDTESGATESEDTSAQKNRSCRY